MAKLNKEQKLNLIKGWLAVNKTNEEIFVLAEQNEFEDTNDIVFSYIEEVESTKNEDVEKTEEKIDEEIIQSGPTQEELDAVAKEREDERNEDIENQLRDLEVNSEGDYVESDEHLVVAERKEKQRLRFLEKENSELKEKLSEYKDQSVLVENQKKVIEKLRKELVEKNS